AHARPPVAPCARGALAVAGAGRVGVHGRGGLRDAAGLARGQVDDGAALARAAVGVALEEVARRRELEVGVAAARRRGDEHEGRHPQAPKAKVPHRSPAHRFFVVALAARAGALEVSAELDDAAFPPVAAARLVRGAALAARAGDPGVSAAVALSAVRLLVSLE